MNRIYYTLLKALLFVSIVCSCSLNHSTIVVNTLAELKDEVLKAQPGDTIIISDNVYTDKEVELFAQGTLENPIVLQSQTTGGVIIHSPLRLTGSYLTLAGLKFTENGSLAVEGEGLRIHSCEMTNLQEGKWIIVHPGSKSIEIDHCRFSKKEINRELPRDCQLIQIKVRNQDEKHHIHHNHFYDIPKGASINGYESLQLITDGNPFDPPGSSSNTIIENNLFERCNGEAEIISIKSNGNIIRNNTFRACAGELVLRTGDNNAVTGNYFFGDGETGSGGVRLQGKDQIVANNYFHALGKFGVALMDGGSNNFYVLVERANIVFNTFVNCKHAFFVGLGHPKMTDPMPPKKCVIAGNIIYSKSDYLPGSDYISDIIKLADNNSEAWSWLEKSWLDKNADIEQYDESRQNQPEEWTWSDNIAYADLKTPEIDGVNAQDPYLNFMDNHVATPTKRTPSIKQPMELNGCEQDLFGSKRKTRGTIGAIEFSKKKSIAGPLTRMQVGPFGKLR
jgi:poly(beta-D-mannuronate) lyase